MRGFEGYVGGQMGSGQAVNDLAFVMLLALAFAFSLLFNAYPYLFGRMLRNVFHAKERESSFDASTGNEGLFRSFMDFQALFLASLFLFLAGYRSGLFPAGMDMDNYLLLFGFFFAVALLFYFSKRFLYLLLGFTFASPEQYRLWRVGYSAGIGFWGVTLYLPVVILAFTRMDLHWLLFVFVLLFLLWRIALNYKTISLFELRFGNILYIFLYLCAQEMMPLLCLYEGMKYMYNLFEINTLWV
ncbi:MAG: DUF4271 domain-containing protein [Tannerella sp.]|jgi:hypothetical protein|nr:DUF4271 domain-containing protein [Tannerella sp.]